MENDFYNNPGIEHMDNAEDLTDLERRFLDAVRAMPESKQEALLRVMASRLQNDSTFNSIQEIEFLVNQAENLQ